MLKLTRPFQTGPLRPGHRAGLDGLYYVGSYTGPGIGMPMCLISGEHAAAALREDYPEALGGGSEKAAGPTAGP